MSLAKTLLAMMLLLLLPSLAPAAEGEGEAAVGQAAYVVLDYRYEPAGSGGDPDIGHSLCATRCNAMSFNYADYIMADPREVKRVAANRELTVPLDNPFLKGHCICTVDEYLVTPNTRNRPKTR